MKPIVLIQTGDRSMVVILPLTPDSHSDESWSQMENLIKDACVGAFDTDMPLEIEMVEAIVEKHPEWKCWALECISISIQSLDDDEDFG